MWKRVYGGKTLRPTGHGCALVYRRFRRWNVALLVGMLVACSLGASDTSTPGAEGTMCRPTPADSLGPFYEPNAPERSSVGKGYVLSGAVRSSDDCSPIAGARVEFWLTGPDGRYDDDHRATVFAAADGKYTFESNFPPAYGNRPAHIHIRVTASGFQTLVTQHYPVARQTTGALDLVLISAR